MIQKPAFVLPAIKSIFGIIFKAILILFLFFKNTVFPYKTLVYYMEGTEDVIFSGRTKGQRSKKHLEVEPLKY